MAKVWLFIGEIIAVLILNMRIIKTDKKPNHFIKSSLFKSLRLRSNEEKIGAEYIFTVKNKTG